ncbi:FkbM family methyltransferase [Phenylobacterium sp.]|jgi:FkbM family methyltransferase|uniref:FkbM family methyltransferase n=1 Tax=Phenylobacterium sp. TaxID=1871053 RepID=UPI002F92C4FC
MASPRIIYDFGANNGDDIPYYLLKAERVVAVEANPVLADQIRSRFADAISAGRLSVESCALTVGESPDSVPFYVHKTEHVLSQFPQPAPRYLSSYDRIEVPARNVLDLVREHGAPHYIKIDIEHFDHVILRALFNAGIYPPYVSAEAHTIDVFALLVVGRYAAFKLVDGKTVPTKYKNCQVATPDGPQTYSFPEHSAGPFGEDISGPWMNKNNFFRVLSYAGLGWRDIHASRVDEPDHRHAPQPRFEVNVRVDY